MSYNYFGGVSNNPIERCKNIPPWVWRDGAFSNEEIEQICKISSKNLEQSKVFTSGNEPENAIKHEEVRVCDIAFHNPNEENFWIFERINHIINDINYRFYNFDLNGYHAYQYAEYNSSVFGKYDFHMDTIMPDLHQPEMRKLSITLLLSDPNIDYEGGEFEFMRSDNLETVKFVKGRMIIFPSFLLHRVKPVTKGIRKSLVVWITGPKFR